MEKVLGQAEIDALFASAVAESEVTSPTPEVALRTFDFGNSSQISAEQMRAVDAVNDSFARNLMHTFGAWLRTDFNAALVSREQMPYGEFIESLPAKTFVCSLRLQPLSASGLLEMEQALVWPMIDLLLGGLGTGGTQTPRQLTDIEDLIMVSVVEMMLKELNIAWQPVGLHLAFDKRESVSQVTGMMSAGEKTLCMSFEVKMGGGISGTINICLPALVLNTTMRNLASGQGRRRHHSPEMIGRVHELVGHASVGAVLQFPSIRMRGQELIDLKLGMLLRLPIPAHTDAELRVGGLSFCKAGMVRIGEHRGARVEAGAHAQTAELTQ